MSLLGRQIDHYEIIRSLGAGGMGEVYEANDTQLRRRVAIKVIRQDLGDSKDHADRFEREARSLSQLSHPHVCTVHGFGNERGFRYLVLELLEGESLEMRLKRGPLSPAEAAAIAAQIAAALAAAHRCGIVHRDLKPGNVMLTPHGVKLIDFGLARLQPFADAAPHTVAEPQLTSEGMLLGTLQYMSPEQIEGKDIDARSDVFSFGAVLYEMLSGTPAFGADSRAGVIASVLHDHPQPVAPPLSSLHSHLQFILDLCLRKDPDDRWQSMRDLELQLRGPNISAASSTRRDFKLRWLGAAALSLSLACFALGWFLHRPSNHPALMRVSIDPPQGWYFDPSSVSISPDGSRVAFVAFAKEGQQRLWLRSLSSSTAQPFEGTEDAMYPFWSPDGRRVGFFASGKMRALNIESGEVSVIADAPYGRGGAWSREDIIVFAPALGGPLLKISAAGGVPEAVTHVPPSTAEGHRWPSFLPDGKHFLFFRDWAANPGVNPDGLYVGSIDAAPEQLISPKILGKAVYSASRLLYLSARSLVAESFDLNKMKLAGDPVAIVQQEMIQDPGFKISAFSISAAGAVVFPSFANAGTRLVWFDRTGKDLGELPLRGCQEMSFAPEGTFFAATCDEAGNGRRNIYLYDYNRGVATRISNGGDDSSPIFAADGKSIFYSAEGATKLNVISTDGSGATRTLLSSSRITPSSASPDGRYVLSMDFKDGPPQLTAYDLHENRAFRFAQFGAEPQYSPDSKWVAYTVNSNSGKNQVVVRSTAPGGKLVQVSNDAGAQPRWSPDGRHLFYIAPDRKLIQVDFSAPDFAPSVPKALFTTPIYATRFVLAAYAITPDGNRFLIDSLPSTGPPVTLLTDWRPLTAASK